jgi:hypothetical protein
VRSVVFGIVQLLCRAVPGRHVAWIIVVPQQHAAFELFAQTDAAVHLALCKYCASHRFHRLRLLGLAKVDEEWIYGLVKDWVLGVPN